MLVIATIVTFFLYLLGIKSKLRLFLLAIREDELAAEVVGINTLKYKMFAFSFSGLFAVQISLFIHEYFWSNLSRDNFAYAARVA